MRCRLILYAPLKYNVFRNAPVYGPGESWCNFLPRVGACTMAKALYGSARTTPRLRADLQASKESTRSPAAIDSCELRTVEGKTHLFLAIDRVSKFVFVELHPRQAMPVDRGWSASEFPSRLPPGASFQRPPRPHPAPPKE